MGENKLIETKLHIPPMPSGLIYRTHIVNRLIAARNCRLISISGLAGSGKTCLACQWLNTTGLKAVWYSIDEVDNDADLFFRYFLTAFSRIGEKTANQVKPLLFNQKRISVEAVLPLLIECSKDLAEEVYVVLDDYHLLHSENIHRALSYLLDHLPPGMHLVLISRHPLPFSIAHLKLRNLVNEIVAEDLKFTWQETQRYFAEIFPISLSKAEMHELNNYLEGWVGGMQLFGISLNGKETLGSLNDIGARACREAMAFLVDQVVNRQPPSVRLFLQHTALLGRFNLDLGRVVTGLADAPDIMRFVCRNNLFVVPLDAQHRWYRYHQLLSGVIRKQMKRLSPAAVATTHRRAALWFAEKGLLEDAFQQGFASEDYGFISDLLEDYLPQLYDHYEVAAFRRWMAKLPHHIFMKRPLLKLHQCRFKIESFQFLEAKSILKGIEAGGDASWEGYKDEKRKLCQDYLLLLKCMLTFWTDPLSVDVNQHRAALKQISPQNKAFISTIKVDIAGSYFIQGEMLIAEQVLKEIAADVLACEGILVKIIWYRLMIGVERWLGQRQRSESVLQDTYRFIDRMGLGDAPIKFMLYFETAWQHYFDNDPVQSGKYATLALNYLDEITGYVHEIIEGHYLVALSYIAQGKIESAETHCLELKRISKSSDNSYVIALAEALCARVSVAIGDLEWVETWVNRRSLHLDEPFSYRFVHEGLAHAELHIGKKEYTRALQVLEPLRKRCVKRHLAEILLNIDLLRCMAFYGRGDVDRVDSIMETQFAYAETQGYLMPFVRYAKPLRPILNKVADGLGSNYVRRNFRVKVLEACGIDLNPLPDALPHGRRLREGLTPREVEILTLLAEGFKYREIAEKSYISIDTVRTHIRHVFNKLGVNTRVHAVKRAEVLGIINS